MGDAAGEFAEGSQSLQSHQFRLTPSLFRDIPQHPKLPHQAPVRQPNRHAIAFQKLLWVGQREQVKLRLCQIGEGGVHKGSHLFGVKGASAKGVFEDLNRLIAKLSHWHPDQSAEALVDIIQKTIGQHQSDAFLNAFKNRRQLLCQFCLTAQQVRPLHNATELAGEGLKEGEVLLVEGIEPLRFQIEDSDHLLASPNGDTNFREGLLSSRKVVRVGADIPFQNGFARSGDIAHNAPLNGQAKTDRGLWRRRRIGCHQLQKLAIFSEQRNAHGVARDDLRQALAKALRHLPPIRSQTGLHDEVVEQLRFLPTLRHLLS